MNFVFVLILLYSNVRGQLQGGEKADPNQFPYVVQIHDKVPNMKRTGKKFENPKRLCTGVIIHARFVLTAAHCITEASKAIDHWDKTAEKLWIIAGDVHLDSDNFQYVQRKVDDMVYHHKFDARASTHDIALLYFNTPLPIGSNSVKAIQIGKKENYPEFGTRCRVAHWGWTNTINEEDDPNSRSHYLKYVSGTIVKGWMKCGLLNKVDKWIFCVEFDNTGIRVLFGDSGGPLLCKVPVTDRNGRVTEKEMLFGTLIGSGNDVDKVDKKTVTVSRGSYTKVYEHLEWIDGKMKTLKEKAATKMEEKIRGGRILMQRERERRVERERQRQKKRRRQERREQHEKNRNHPDL